MYHPFVHSLCVSLQRVEARFVAIYTINIVDKGTYAGIWYRDLIGIGTMGAPGAGVPPKYFRKGAEPPNSPA